eukprot:64336_1
MIYYQLNPIPNNYIQPIKTMKTSVEVNSAQTTGEQRGDPRETWQTLSAEKCSCNESWDCCTLHCCGLCILVLWIIGGLIIALLSWSILAIIETQEFVTQPCCLEAQPDYCWDTCCGAGELMYPAFTCQRFTNMFSISLADGIC